METKEQYLEKINAVYNNVHDKIRELKPEAEKSDEKTRKKINKHIEKLEEKQKHLKIKMDEIKAIDEKDIAGVQVSYGDTLEEIENLVNKPASSFNTNF